MNLGKRSALTSLFVSLGASAVFAVAGVALAAPPASPVPAESRANLGLGTWEGTGTARAMGGQDLGAFDVSLKRTAAGSATRTDGRVVLADGRVITFWQRIEPGATGGFRLTSDTGSGGGQCFANGMCQFYEVRQSDGHAFATTVVKDGDRGLRVLVTELEQGKAVRFFEQTLAKKD